MFYTLMVNLVNESFKQLPVQGSSCLHATCNSDTYTPEVISTIACGIDSRHVRLSQFINRYQPFIIEHHSRILGDSTRLRKRNAGKGSSHRNSIRAGEYDPPEIPFIMIKFGNRIFEHRDV